MCGQFLQQQQETMTGGCHSGRICVRIISPGGHIHTQSNPESFWFIRSRVGLRNCFFFFFLHLEPVPRWFYWSRNCTWKSTIVITVHGHACQEGSGDQEDVGYLCRDPRTSNNNTAVITSITGIIISILSGWYLCFSSALKWLSMGKWNGIPKSFQFF